ncbi:MULTISPECIES: hypothetical protein [unclassified Nocardioides]|uniref:hypothetical protein n=1 Tax=unclassified Nocardioides TaxID=2615069 RepID=UPI000AD77475|nr:MULTISPECIES: hypothetical protein [unclassified Nocardioides]
MTLRHLSPLSRLLVSAGAVLTLGATSAVGLPLASASAPTSASSARVIVYSNAHSPGVEVTRASQARRLHGAPASFKRFIGRTAQRISDASTCEGGYVGVTVFRLRTDGFAAGGVNDCGGYAALWAVVDGRWKQIEGTQEIWACAPLRRHRVPSSIAGHTCYDYRHQVQRRYHQA